MYTTKLQCGRCDQPLWRNFSDAYHRLDREHLCRKCLDAGWTVSVFGECQICNRHDGCRHIWSSHWFYCDTHRVRWSPGSNLLSTWKKQTVEEFEKNVSYLAEYCEVEPSIFKSPESPQGGKCAARSTREELDPPL